MRAAPRAIALALAIAFAIAGCGGAAPSSSPIAVAPTASPVPSVAPTPSASPSVSATPSPSPSAATASPTIAAACPVESQTGLLPSDRMTNVEIAALPGRDVVRFSFGKRSLQPTGPSTGSLDAAKPPFTGGASGLPIDLKGGHAVQVVFRGMSLQNDVGQLAYDGPREFEVTDPSRSLRHLVLFDESEGQLGWYAGYDGPGCVSLAREGDSILLTFDVGAPR